MSNYRIQFYDEQSGATPTTIIRASSDTEAMTAFSGLYPFRVLKVERA